MPLPDLIHPVNVTIERIDRAATVYDPDAREPVQHAARRVAVTLPGQVRWTSQQDLEMREEGPSERSSGYVLFRKFDLDNHPSGPITIQKGDRFTAEGHITQEVYVIRIQPRGHYPDQNGPALLKCWFSDRKPAKER